MTTLARAHEALEKLVELRSVGMKMAAATNLTPRDKYARNVALSTLYQAEPLWWEQTILDVIEQARTALPRWTIRRELFPVASGFCWFSRPMPLRPHKYESGVEGLDPMVGFSWAERGDSSDLGVAMVAWTNAGKEQPYPAFATETRYGEMMNGPNSVGVDPQMRMRDISPNPRQQEMLATMGSALLFIEQKIASMSQVDPDRAMRRRIAKSNSMKLPTLRMVTLRHRQRTPSSIKNEHDPIEWQSRWLVRGHWRQQFYPSDHSNRPKWIHPYLKGPEDKPLRAPDQRLFAVVR